MLTLVTVKAPSASRASLRSSIRLRFLCLFATIRNWSRVIPLSMRLFAIARAVFNPMTVSSNTIRVNELSLARSAAADMGMRGASMTVVAYAYRQADTALTTLL